jgi:hypothetical protein
MLRLQLNRTFFPGHCILGRLTELQTGRGWESMEPQWIPSSGPGGGPLSCLPLGDYRVERYHTEAYPNVYALSAPVMGVYVREQDAPASLNGSARLRQVIQPATFSTELRGGIAIGKERVKGPGGLWKIERSRDALNELRNMLGMAMDVTLSITSGSV